MFHGAHRLKLCREKARRKEWGVGQQFACCEIAARTGLMSGLSATLQRNLTLFDRFLAILQYLLDLFLRLHAARQHGIEIKEAGASEHKGHQCVIVPDLALGGEVEERRHHLNEQRLLQMALDIEEEQR